MWFGLGLHTKTSWLDLACVFFYLRSNSVFRFVQFYLTCLALFPSQFVCPLKFAFGLSLGLCHKSTTKTSQYTGLGTAWVTSVAGNHFKLLIRTVSPQVFPTIHMLSAVLHFVFSFFVISILLDSLPADRCGWHDPTNRKHFKIKYHWQTYKSVFTLFKAGIFLWFLLAYSFNS